MLHNITTSQFQLDSGVTDYPTVMFKLEDRDGVQTLVRYDQPFVPCYKPKENEEDPDIIVGYSGQGWQETSAMPVAEPIDESTGVIAQVQFASLIYATLIPAE